jgi:hypothetical protein
VSSIYRDRTSSQAIALGYRLHGGPAVTFNGEQVIVAQALLWPGAGDVSQGEPLSPTW